MVKIYGTDTLTPYLKYGTSDCIGTEKTIVSDDPDRKHIATSYVERQNLIMRMHWLAIALHFVYYNFAKVHKTLRVTPAMEAGLAKKPMTIEEIVRLTEGAE